MDLSFILYLLFLVVDVQLFLWGSVTSVGGNFCIGIFSSFYFVVDSYLCRIYFAGSVD